MIGLYRRLPATLQHGAVTAYGLYTRWYRYGRDFRRWYRFLRRSERWTLTQLVEWQSAEFRKLFDHCRETVPLYASLSPNSWCGLPLLTKEALRAEPRQAITSGRLAVGDTLYTGGTTGTPLPVYTNRQARERHYAFFARLVTWLTGDPHPRTAIFAGRTVVPVSESRVFWRRSWNTLHLSSYHLSLATVERYARALDRFRPALMDSYPSSLDLLAQYYQDHPPAWRPRAIITSSETLSADLRCRISAAFACPVTDYYSSTEMAAFIAQCPRGAYHAHPEYGLVEILAADGQPAEPGEQGELVVTPFVNRVMPLIRYRTGDLARWARKPCGCGLAFPALEALEGRADDVIVLPDGRRIGRLDSLFKHVHGVAETQLVQDAANHVTVRVVPADLDHVRDGIGTLEAAMRVRFGPAMRLTFTLVDAIPRTGRGKRQTVVREWDG